jgi:hypothetical protein
LSWQRIGLFKSPYLPLYIGRKAAGSSPSLWFWITDEIDDELKVVSNKDGIAGLTGVADLVSS